MEERREDVKKTVLGDKKLRDIIWEKLSVIDKGEEQVLVLPWHLGREARDKTEPLRISVRHVKLPRKSTGPERQRSLGSVVDTQVQAESEIYPIESHIIRLGDIAIATNPFELFLDYGNRMKARSLAQQTFIFQLTGGAGGYLPTQKAEQGSHYSAYITSGNVGHEGGDLLVRRTVEEINEMFE